MITSVQNDRVKSWQKLKKRKVREETNCFLVEGYHMIEEALKSDWKVKEVILGEGAEIPVWIKDLDTYFVSNHILKSITDTKTPQGIAAVVEMNQPEKLQFQKLLLVDKVQDPGNLGTMVRTADAAGFDAVYVGSGSVDIFNEKVLRSTQGSLFHLPIFQENLIPVIEQLKTDGFAIWASTLEDAKPYSSLTVPAKAALVVGNEGAGIAGDIIERATDKVQIPIWGKAESLNVSVAAGILIYHLAHLFEK
ncbi:TrmH family RNA methyltransferase [Sediminibacillus albus]|uniref:RNA methyltransferase, TrmH family n=1 Tax=Sediminibacillus albus TaxID=407036 RepID=A0A1G9BRW9_9BACI|nr:RNA methyltransferase [Sediminibacillus albus]SDK42231.1 RNA methyltransferase, TrmH family [Sediminibacillus albus]